MQNASAKCEHATAAATATSSSNIYNNDDNTCAAIGITFHKSKNNNRKITSGVTRKHSAKRAQPQGLLRLPGIEGEREGEGVSERERVGSMDGAIDGPNAAIDGQQDDCDGTVMFLQCTL